MYHSYHILYVYCKLSWTRSYGSQQGCISCHVRSIRVRHNYQYATLKHRAHTLTTDFLAKLNVLLILNVKIYVIHVDIMRLSIKSVVII